MQGINSIYHDLGYVHTIADSLSFRQEKPQNLSQNWYKSSTHIEHCAGAVAREGLVLEIPILTPEYLTSAAVVSVLFAYSFTFISARILVHIAPKCGTKRIRYMPRSTLEIFTTQISVCYRNRTEVTRSPSYPMLFSYRRKKYPV